MSQFQMHPEQSYVLETAQKLALEARLVHHGVETRTCQEKADLLTQTTGNVWPAERVIKAVYFNSSNENSHYVGIVTPEMKKTIDVVATLMSVNGLSRGKARNYSVKNAPRGMSQGTCTPFPLSSAFSYMHPPVISSILIFDFPHLDDQIVDISLGGSTPEARKASMHLSYGAIYKILREEFPNVVCKVVPRFNLKD